MPSAALAAATNPGTSVVGAPVAADRVEAGSGGVFGIFTNAFRDLKDIVGGVGQLGGIVLHDVAHAATLGAFDREGGFLTDNVVKAAPGAIAHDYAERYGSVGKFGKGLYEHPLSFISDALTVATAGGWAAGKAASLAGTLGDVGAAAKVAGAATVAEEVGMLKAGTLGLEDMGKAAQFVNTVQGTATKVMNPITHVVETVDPIANPVKRALYQRSLLKATSTDIGKYAPAAAERAVAMAHDAQELGPAGLSMWKSAENVSTLAEEALQRGATRVSHEFWAKHNIRGTVDYLLGASKARTQRETLEVLKPLQDELKTITSNGVDSGMVAPTILGQDGTLVHDGYIASDGVRRTEVLAGEHGLPVAVAPDVPTVWPSAGVAADAEHGLDEVLQGAQDRLAPTVSKLRQKFGPGVVSTSGPKSREGILATAKAMGTSWHAVSDIERYRIVMPDMYAGKTADQAIKDIAETMGGKVKTIENSVLSPDAGGERGIRVVMQVEDHPVEFQLLSPTAARASDATASIRQWALRTGTRLRDGGKVIGDEAEKFDKAMRLSQHSWEAVTNEVREQLGGKPVTEMRKSMDRLRLTVAEKLTGPAIDAGIEPAQAFDNAYMALRLQNGASYGEKEVRGGMSSLELDKMLAESGDMAPIYYPLIDARRLPSRGDFLLKNPSNNLLNAVADTGLKKNTGYLLSKDLYVKDPMRAYAVRARRAIAARESVHFINNTLTEYGRPIRSWSDKTEGEVLWSPKMMRDLYGSQAALEDAAMEALQQGDDGAKNIADMLKRITIQNQEQLSHLKDTELVAVPKVVSDRLAQHAKVYFGETVDVAVRTPTQLWKSMVLAGSPRWVVNNLLGNVVFLKTQGGRLSDVVRQLSPKYRRAVKEAIGENAIGGVEGSLTQSLLDDVRPFSDDTFAGLAAGKLQQSAPLNTAMKPFRKFGDMVHHANEAVEDAFRRASYLKAAEKVAIKDGVATTLQGFWTSKKTLEGVFSVGLDERGYGRAVKEVDKFLNDYRKMTPFGRNIIRPYVAPFWGFYRHSAKVLGAMPFEQPGVAQMFRALDETIAQEQDRLGPVPDFLEGALPINWGADPADARFMSTRGANPFDAVVSNPANLLHPAWKMLFESSTGRSSLTGKQFTDPNVVSSFGSGQQYKMGADGATEPVDTVRPPLFEQLLSQVPQYDMVKDIIGQGSTYDTANLGQVAQDRLSGSGQAIIRDPLTGAPVYPKPLLQTLAKAMGFSSYSTDLAAFQAKRLEEQASALSTYNKRFPTAG